MVTVKDIMYFLNTETDYPKWKGEIWNQYNGEYVLLTDDMLKKYNQLYLSFSEYDNCLKVRVSDYCFKTYKDHYEHYGDTTTVEDKDLSKPWRAFMAERYPDYTKELKGFAEKRLHEKMKEYNNKRDELIRKLDKEYQSSTQPFKDMLDFANSFDGKQLD